MSPSTTATPSSSSGLDAGPTSNGTTTPTDPDTTQGPGSATDDATDTSDPTTGEIPPNCGDGMLDADEACDDGNMTDSDGCNNDCTVSGSVLWFHTQASGVGVNEEAYGVVVDDQARAYVAAEAYGAASLDFWVRQYADDGLGWTQVLDGSGSNEGARAIARHGGTIYAAGRINVPAQSNNVWLRGFDLDGNPGIDVTYNDALSGNDIAYGVAVKPGGNIVVAAHEAIDLQGANILVREYMPSGALANQAVYGGPAAAADHPHAVAIDGSGNVVVVGFHTVPVEGRDFWIRYYDPNLNEIWTQNPSGVNMLGDEAWGVAFDPEGNVVVTGFEGDPLIGTRLWLAKYDPTSAELWTQSWDGEGGEGAQGLGVAVDDLGDIVVTGVHRLAGFDQLLVRKLDPDGMERWTTTIEGAPRTHQVGRGVAIGPGRRVWVAGGVDQGVDGRDVYVARLAP